MHWDYIFTEIQFLPSWPLGLAPWACQDYIALLISARNIVYLSTVVHRCSVPYVQALGFYRNYVSGPLGGDYKFYSKQVPKLNGGKHDLLVFLLHSWPTHVCATILPWLDESEGKHWINMNKLTARRRVVLKITPCENHPSPCVVSILSSPVSTLHTMENVNWSFD